MPHSLVPETDFAGFVMEREARSLLALELLEASIDERRRFFGSESGLSSLDDEKRLLYRQTLRQVPVVRQRAPAVANREYCRDQLDLFAFANLLYGIQVPEKP